MKTNLNACFEKNSRSHHRHASHEDLLEEENEVGPSESKTSMDVAKLMDRVSELESRLGEESARKSSLEEQVEALKEENLRLQEESATASQQLKRFTEWFFQTIDKNGTS